MSAAHVTELGTLPEATDMTRDAIIAAITAEKRPGVTYRFEVFDGPECEHCGKPASPLMRFSRMLPREAWIIGTPDDGTRDKLACTVTVADPRIDAEAAAAVVAELESIVAELNASP